MILKGLALKNCNYFAEPVKSFINPIFAKIFMICPFFKVN